MYRSSTRRRTLAAIGAGMVSLAGCTAGYVGPRAESERSLPAPPTAPDLPVPASELVRAAPRDGIAAITDPVFGRDWSGITLELESDFRGTTLAPASHVSQLFWFAWLDLQPGTDVYGVDG